MTDVDDDWYTDNIIEFSFCSILLVFFFFFFFKQKTAYEIRLSLVGSEMCIRDRWTTGVS